MAEGVLRHYGGDQYEVFSAGLFPTQINKTVIQVMKEIGIDVSHQRAKSIEEFKDQKVDTVITVCDNAKETCPLFPGARVQLHWSFQDPPHGQEVTEEVVKEFRRIRDQIHEKFKKAAEEGIEE